MFGKTQKIHFVGVGGIGMSGMAELLHCLGFDISGSDISASDRTEHLSKLGIKALVAATLATLLTGNIAGYVMI